MARAAGYSMYDHDGYEGDHSAIQKIAAEHGPARAHQHFQDGMTHRVVSHHGDGHLHISKGHPTFEHAHEHIGIAHGIA